MIARSIVRPTVNSIIANRPTFSEMVGAGGVLFLPDQHRVYSDAGTTPADFGDTVQQWSAAHGGVSATQGTAANRMALGRAPVRGRVNILDDSDDLSEWFAIFATVTPATPQGGYDLYRVETGAGVPAGSILGRLQQLQSLSLGVHTWRAIATANDSDEIAMVVTCTGGAQVGEAGSSQRVAFNTSSETFTTQQIGGTAIYDAEEVSSGLWQITLTFEVTTAGDIYVQRAVELITASGVSDGKFVLMGRSQLEAGGTATTHQTVTSDLDVIEEGAAAPAYLLDDLTDDAYSVTPATTLNHALICTRKASVLVAKAMPAATPVVFGSGWAGFDAGLATEIDDGDGTARHVAWMLFSEAPSTGTLNAALSLVAQRGAGPLVDLT